MGATGDVAADQVGVPRFELGRVHRVHREHAVAKPRRDALELTHEQQRILGRVVSSANNGTVIETIARLAGGLGIAPWVPLQSMHKVWLRSNRGGAIAVYRVNERAARIEVWQAPLARSPFFRVSLCGTVEHGLHLFRRAARVVEDERDPIPNGFALRATW